MPKRSHGSRRSRQEDGNNGKREIYERAIEVLPDKKAQIMCLRYAELEKRLGEIDRSRSIFTHGSQFADPRIDTLYWQKWRLFEVEHGNEDTFREMLRIKRSVQAQFNTTGNFVANQMATSFVPAVDTKPIGGQIISENNQRFETDMEVLERLSTQVSNGSNGNSLMNLKEKVINPESIELKEEEEEEEDEDEEGDEEGEEDGKKKKKNKKDTIELEALEVPKAVFDRNVGHKSKATNEGALERIKKKRG